MTDGPIPPGNRVPGTVVLAAQDKLAECLGLHMRGPELTLLDLPQRVETTGGDHLTAFAYATIVEAGGGTTWFMVAHPYRDTSRFVFCITGPSGIWDKDYTFTDRDDYQVVASRLAGH